MFHSTSLTLALLLLQCGPPAAFWAFVIAPRSLLILIALASSFYWTGTLIASAVALQGIVSHLPSTKAASLAVLIVVSVEEAARYTLYLLHRRALRMLSGAALKSPHLSFRSYDESLIALAAGFGHAATHSLMFSIAWSSLASGKGVFYTSHCSSMSWAPAAAFTTLGFFMLHTGSMIIAFDGLSTGRVYVAVAVSIVHLCAAFLTLLNLQGNFCGLVAVAEIVLGLGSSAVAAAVMRTRFRSDRQYSQVRQTEQLGGTCRLETT